MPLETGQEIDVWIAEETNYDEPVIPTSGNQMFVVSCNLSPTREYVRDETAYSPYAATFDEARGRESGSFEMVCLVPIANDGPAATDTTKRTAFTTWLEALQGKAVVAADLAANNGELPTFTAGDAFIALSGDKADQFDGGAEPALNSFDLWKKTRNGHEVGVGAVIQEATLGLALNSYMRITFRGAMSRWAKFEECELKAAITAGSKTSAELKFSVGMIGVGAYVNITHDDNTTQTVLVTSATYDKAGDKVTIGFAATTFKAAAVGKKVVDAFPPRLKGDRIIKNIYGDNFRISLDGGTSLIEKISSCDVTMRSGVLLFNEDATSDHATETYQGDVEVTVALTATLDPSDLELLRAGFTGEDQQLMVLAGGLDVAANGGRMLVEIPVIRMRLAAPTTPRSGMATVSMTGMARAQLTGSTLEYKAPATLYLR